MQNDIRRFYEQELDASHHGRPEIVQQIRTGARGRPRTHIDPEFLRWAYSMRSTSSIARFLNVDRSTVRHALLQYGIAEPQSNPFAGSHELLNEELDDTNPDPGETSADDLLNTDPGETSADDLLNPIPTNPISHLLPPTANTDHTPPDIISYTGPLSSISDSDLDTLIHTIRQQFVRAGVSMLDGMLRTLGHRVPSQRIRDSLHRIDPVQRVFERIRIRRHVYSVPGPNSLWHHDGQHGIYLLYAVHEFFLIYLLVPGLIRWGIVIHGFIDGYSRLITALQASNNNRGETVLNLFQQAATVYGVPSRIRGDHGVENIQLAAWMEMHRGERRGSYIWGRYVTMHNLQ